MLVLKNAMLECACAPVQLCNMDNGIDVAVEMLFLSHNMRWSSLQESQRS
jgi:hypothetical protein